MYKKINTTRNSSFKKASIFIAVAAFASCAVFLGTERFNYNGESASSVYAGYKRGLFDSSRNRRSFFGSSFRSGRYGKYRFRDDRSLSDLTNNQRVNFEAVLKEAKLIIEEMRERLTNLDGMPEYVDGLDISDLGTIPNRVAKYIFDTDVFDKLVLPQDNPYDVNELFGSMKDCLQRLSDCQNYLLAVIQSMGTLLELDRMKGKEKIEELKNSDLGQLIKCPKDLIKLAGLDKIKSNGSSSVDKAKKIIENALKAFFNATTFDETEKHDPWATNYWSTHRYKDRSCYSLVATLQTLLYINQQINSVYDHVIASEVVGSLQQAFKGLLSREDGIYAGLLRKGKVEFFNRLKSGHRTELLMMPFVLATVAKKSDLQTEPFKGVDFEGAGEIKELCEKFVDKLVAAFQSDRQTRDLISVLHDLTDKTVNKTKKESITYDIGKILVDTVKTDAAKRLLKGMDTTLEEAVFSKNVFEKIYKRAVEAGKTTNADIIKQLYEGYDGQEGAGAKFDRGHADYRFVDSTGNLNSAKVEIELGSPIHSEIVKGAATVLSVPKCIRNLALVKLIIDKYNYNYNSTAILEDDLSSWFSLTRFNSAVSEVAGKIQSIYSDSKKAIQKVSQVKSKEKSTKKTKKESSESKSGRSITNMLLLDAANRNSNSLAIKAQGKTIEVSNLSSNVKKLSPVLCPKVSPNSKEGDKNIDLPLVDVVDGKATIDLTTQLNAAGNYELHFRNAELDPATKNVVNYAFLLKSKFAYAADKTKPQSMCKITVEQADDSYLDFTTAEAILNEDKTVTYRVKAKSAASSNPEIMTGVCIKSNATPNMEKDKFALQLNSDRKTYSFTTNKGLEGNVELHVYNGEIETDNYDGKIVAKTAETTEIESKEGTSIYSLIDKEAGSTSSAVDGFDKKVVKFVLSNDQLDAISDSDPDNFDYEILDSSGKVVHYGTTDKLDKLARTRKGDNVYRVNIKVPKGGKEYTIRLAGSYADDMVLESHDRISSNIENDKEIEFRGVANNWYKDWF